MAVPSSGLSSLEALQHGPEARVVGGEGAEGDRVGAEEDEGEPVLGAAPR